MDSLIKYLKARHPERSTKIGYLMIAVGVAFLMTPDDVREFVEIAPIIVGILVGVVPEK